MLPDGRFAVWVKSVGLIGMSLLSTAVRLFPSDDGDTRSAAWFGVNFGTRSSAACCRPDRGPCRFQLYIRLLNAIGDVWNARTIDR